jgi:DNA polymerase III alpha subunit
MKESRYNTFKKKYEPYKRIYYKNNKSQSFANWYFERELLGFSYSSKLADIFENEKKKANDSMHFKSLDPRESAKYIFVVSYSKKEKSRNGNLYIKVEAEDEHGTVDAILCDTSRERKCSNYLENNPVPKEGNIITLYGEKTRDGDALFINQLKIVDEMIYMNLRDLKAERV